MSVPTAAAPPAAPASRTHHMALAAASGATFMAYIDVTVVNVAVPDLIAGFPGASLGALSWTVTAYAVAFAALLTAAGRVADLAGRRRIFVGGVLVFALASALAAAAPSIGWLVAARFLQGAGAAAMIPAALGIVLATAPPERRAAAIGVWGAAGSLAAAAGPALGGVLVDSLGWRSVFLVNLPIAALIAMVALRDVPALPGSAGRRPDAAGTVALAVGIGAAVGALTQSEAWGWADARTLGLLAAGIALAALAVTRSVRAPAPAIDVRLLARRPFALATIAAVFAGAALFAWLLFGVLFLTGVWRYSIGEAGLAVTPGAVVAVFASILAGRWAQQGRGPRAVVLGGALMAVTGVALATATGASPAFVAVWLPSSLVSGFAFGLLMTGVATSAAAALPPERFAAGTGLNLTARQIGGALAVALAAALVAGSGGDAAYDRVWLLCAAAGAGAGLTGVALAAAQERRA